jgi:hypothetical protein
MGCELVRKPSSIAKLANKKPVFRNSSKVRSYRVIGTPFQPLFLLLEAIRPKLEVFHPLYSSLTFLKKV